MFKKLKGALGGSGVSVDAILHSPDVQPGGVIQGHVEMKGGQKDVKINHLTLGLEVRVEVEYEDSQGQDRETTGTERFGQVKVAQDFSLAAGASESMQFQLPVPIQCPINVVGHVEMHKVKVGVRTELDVARAIDKGDLDPLRVHPFPAQQRILDAFANIGFQYHSSDCERGRMPGSDYNFYQEIEFHPPEHFRRSLKELEVTFLARTNAMEIVMELSKKGILTARDQENRITVDYQSFGTTDWETRLSEHLTGLLQKRGLFR